jgi:hypothetical protein
MLARRLTTTHGASIVAAMIWLRTGLGLAMRCQAHTLIEAHGSSARMLLPIVRL